MSILAPALTRVRAQAKDSLCMSRLHQWGAIFSMYADSNDGRLTGWHELKPGDETYAPPDAGVTFHAQCWIPRLRKYYAEPMKWKQVGGEWVCGSKDWDFCMCPSTEKTWADGEFGGPMTGWDFGWMHDMAGGEYLPYYDSSYGSYGKNGWVSDTQTKHGAAGDLGVTAYWDTTRVRNASRIPLFGDESMMSGYPAPTCEVPQHKIRMPMDEGEEISRWVQDRHDLTVNLVFLDFTVRKVGLKQLWQLYWHRDWDLSLTPDPKDPEQWPSWIWPSPMIELGF